MSDRKTQAAILRRLEELEFEEQNIILTKFKGVETDSVREQNEFLMMLLRAHCEMKQARHVHDTAENRSEFLNQYLGGGTIFMKAKRSLTNSFEMLKRKASKDDFGPVLKEMNLPIAPLNKVCLYRVLETIEAFSLLVDNSSRLLASSDHFLLSLVIIFFVFVLFYFCLEYGSLFQLPHLLCFDSVNY